MPRYDSHSDDDRDLPLPGDMDDSDELAEMACPNCRGVVTEDTQKCPHCGDWITPVEPAGGSWRRWLFAAAVLLMLYAMVRLIL